MKKKNLLMAGVFGVAILAAFAFKPSKILSNKFGSQTVWYTVTTSCDNSAMCSNSLAATCVIGFALTAYSDNQSPCVTGSLYRYKP